MTQLKIEIFSDVVCPWCLIGVARLDAALATLGDDVEVQVTFRPFLIDPDCPPAGKSIPEMIRQKYGTEPRRMFDHVEAAAKESGIDLDLEAVPYGYPTEAAHILLRHALAKGTQGPLARALFDAYFLAGRNINDDGVLVELATEHGFTDAETRALLADPAERAHTEAEAEAAARSGIRGVPFFVVNDRFAISGAQPPEVFREALDEALAPLASPA